MPRDLLPTDLAYNGRRTVTHARSAPETGGRDNRTSGGVRLPYLPGLDGLRALAVAAVLLYHAGLPWIPGGFLGVEVFFVVSGYLITSLLLAKRHGRGRVDLKAFWLGRACRLLPALYLMLTVTLAFAVVPARRGRKVVRGRGRGVRVRNQLVPRVRPGVLLRDRRASPAAAAPVVRDRGAVLVHFLELGQTIPVLPS